MWFYLKAHKGRAVALSLPLAVALVGVTAGLVVTAPFHQEPIPIRLVLLSPVLVVVAFAPAMKVPATELEAMYAPRARRGRLVVVAALTLALAAAALLVLGLESDLAISLAAGRNGCYLAGALLLAAALVTVDLAWIAPVVLVAVTYAVGLDGMTLEPHPWAFLLATATWADVLLGLAALIAGGGVFVLRRLHDE